MKKFYWDWDEFWLIVITIVTILAIIYGIAYGVVTFRTKKFCLDNGYANAEILFEFSSYCIREENEYEITVPIDEVLERNNE